MSLGQQARFADEWRRRGCWGDETIAEALARTSAQAPNKIALVDADRRLRFAELARQANALAHALAGLGMRAGDVVAYQLPNWAEAVVVVHAAAALGAVANPIPPTYGARESEFILREGEARALFIPGRHRGIDHRAVAAALRPALPRLEHVIVLRDEPGPGDLAFEDLISGSAIDLPRDVVASAPGAPAGTADAVALLIYTSGTTADPKGVLHTHNTLLAEARSLRAIHGLTSDDTVLMPSPLTHISGLIHAILVPAVIGTTAVLMERWDPERGIDLIDREGVTYMVGPPVFVHDLCRVSRARPRRFRLFSCGGADVTPDTIRLAEERLGGVAKRVYGSTELPTLTTTGPGDPPAERRETEGRPIGAAELRIVDDAGRACPPGVEGEILARAPECFVGYRNAALDTEAFDAAGWFRTGDLGIADATGALRITGRKKDIIIRKGENISAREIEALLGTHPDVDDVAVVGVPDPDTGERACAVVQPRPGTAPTLVALVEFIRARGLSTRKLPERLELVAAFPRTASGKIHKAALKERLRRGPGT